MTWTKEQHEKMRALVARVQNPQMIVGQHGAPVRDAHKLWEDKVAMLAEAEEAIPDMLDEIDRLQSEPDERAVRAFVAGCKSGARNGWHDTDDDTAEARRLLAEGMLGTETGGTKA